MPDLTMCRPVQPCPRQERCYRFTATPDEWQSWAAFEPKVSGNCPYFVANSPKDRAQQAEWPRRQG
jgi:hypothetical protein